MRRLDRSVLLAAAIVVAGVIPGSLALLGIILWATRSPARSFAAAGWRSGAADAYAKGGALDGAIRAAERQWALTQGARWQIGR